MHMDKKVYNVKTNKNVFVKIVQISDIHFSAHYNLKRLIKIEKKIDIINPDYVCIIGDLIDSYDSSNIDVFKDWLKGLSDKFKVIVVIGNHDYITFDNGKYIEHSDISWLKSIESENLILLLNNVYRSGNINFIGYNLDFDYYYHHKNVSYDKYNNDLSRLLLNVSDGYNILLVHAPSFFLNNNNYENINGFDRLDLILCGHTHGGLIPSFVPGNFGLVSPTRDLFPKYVRGKFKLGKTILIISSGIMKLSRKSGLSVFNDIYGYNVNVICINDKY